MTRVEAIQQARSATTDAKRLREISKDYYASPDIIAAILQNPNSPLDLLSELSNQAPLALLQNVSLHLFFLEDSGFMRVFPEEVLVALVQEPNTPTWLVEACSLVSQPTGNKPWGVFRRSHSRSQFYVALAKRQELSALLLEDLSVCGDYAAIAIYTKRDDVPAHYIERLLYSSSQGTRALAVKSPNAPKELLSLLHRVGLSALLERYQTPDPTLSQEELEPLLSKGPFIASLVLRHPSFPAERLRQVATELPHCVMGALENPNAPADLLERFPSHTSSVAKHPNTPARLLRRLLINLQPHYQADIFKNPSSPKELVALLQRIESKDLSVKESELLSLAAQSDTMKLLALSHPNMPGDWLFELWRTYLPVRVGSMKQQERDELRLLSAHPRASEQMLVEIAGLDLESIQYRASYRSAKRNALMHPNLPPKSLNDLIQGVEAAPYLHRDLSLVLLQNPKLQREHVAKLVEMSWQHQWLSRLRRALLRHPLLTTKELSRFVSARRALRALVARHSNASANVLQKLAEDAEPNVRFYAAKNPNMPREFAQSLVDCGATPDLFAVSCREVTLSQEQLRALMARGVFARMLAAHACKAEHKELLNVLLQDKRPRVREAAMMNPLLSSERRLPLWNQSSNYTKAALAQNPSATAKELPLHQNPYLDGNYLLYRAIASHRNTTAAQLHLLSNSRHFCVDVAHNPSTPPDTLRQLAAGKILEARRAVALNPSTPKDLLPKLLQRPLRFPLETARLRIELAVEANRERDAQRLLPIFQSNPDFVEKDEGKRVYSLNDAKIFLLGEAALSGSRVYLIYKKAPLSVRPWLRKKELSHAGDELIAVACSIDQHPREPFSWLGLLLIHSRCHRQGLGQEAMRAIERDFYSRGHRELRLAAFQERPQALSFWQSLGYQAYEAALHPLGPKIWKMRKSL